MIDNYNWHDSRFVDLHIGANTDFLDTVEISLMRPDGNKFLFRCTDSVFCNFLGNGWIAGKDSVYCTEYKQGLACLDLVPEHIGEEFRTNLAYLKMEFNTSGTTLEVLARKIDLLQCS